MTQRRKSFCILLCVLAPLRLCVSILPCVFAPLRLCVKPLHHRLHPCLLARLGREREGAHQRHLRAARRVGAPHRARPQPGDHSRLAAAVLLRQLDLRVQMSDAPLGLIAHPPAVVAHVLGQAGCAAPVGFNAKTQRRGDARLFLIFLCVFASLRLCVNWRPPRELRRDLDQRLGDQHRDGVQVAGVRLQPQPLRLQRDRAATAERIEQGRRVAVRGLQDLGARPAQHLLVVDVLPLDQLLDEAEEALALAFLRFFGGELLRVAGWVVHDGREDHRAARGQGAPRPPQVQRARVAVADGLLPRRFAVDGFEREGDFDEFFRMVHGHAEDSNAKTQRREVSIFCVVVALGIEN